MPRSKKFDVRAIVQTVAAALIVGFIGFCGTSIKNTVSSTKATIDGHSKTIEQIPVIQESVNKINKKVEENADSASRGLKALTDKIDGRAWELSQKVDDKTKDLITRNEWNDSQKKITGSLDKLSSDDEIVKLQLARDQAVRDYIQQHQQQPPR